MTTTSTSTTETKIAEKKVEDTTQFSAQEKETGANWMNRLSHTIDSVVADNRELQRRIAEFEASARASSEARLKAEADAKAAQDLLAETNKKLEAGAGSPAGNRLATKIGEDPLKGMADKLDKSKTVKEVRTAGYELVEDTVKKMLERKEIEGPQRSVVHFEKNTVILSAGAALAVAGVACGVSAYVAYNAGHRAGHDAASTVKFNLAD